MDCVCASLLGLVWGQAQPLDYIFVLLFLESIEQPIFILQHVVVICVRGPWVCVYRVVGHCVGGGPTPRLYICTPTLGINSAAHFHPPTLLSHHQPHALTEKQ
jgi:hypothetical protein